MAATTTTRSLRPQPGPQEAFLTSAADIAVYGGAAGGGKTWALLLECLRHLGNPRWRPVVFRRTTPEIRNAGGLWDASSELYPLVGGVPRETTLEWRFPSGARVKFSHLERETDKLSWQGAEIPLVCWDELTHFTRSQFEYVSLSRGRSTSGVRPYTRATCNPDATSWVKEFLAPWLVADHPQRAASGELRGFLRDGPHTEWVPAGTAGALTVTFIRASLFDNAVLMAKDPGYLARLRALPLVERERLLEGNWEILEGGNVFRPEWFPIVAAAPAGLRLCRFWDLAATAPKPGRRDPDYTCGVLMGMRGREFFVLDVQRTRSTPAGVKALLRQTAELDRARYGAGVEIRVEQEPGSSGVFVVEELVRDVLLGFPVRGVRSTGDKRERARPLSAQAEVGNVTLLAGPWNRDYLNFLAAFPNAAVHDDDVDASSGAFAALVSQAPAPVARAVARSG